MGTTSTADTVGATTGGDCSETLNTLVLTEQNGKTTRTCTVLYPASERSGPE